MMIKAITKYYTFISIEMFVLEFLWIPLWRAISSKYPFLFTLPLTNGAVLTRALTLTVLLFSSISVYTALFYKEWEKFALIGY